MSVCIGDYEHRGEINLFFWGEGGTQGFRRPFVNKFVDLLLDGQGNQRIRIPAYKSFQKNE